MRNRSATRADSRNLDEACIWKPFFGGRRVEGGRFDHWRFDARPLERSPNAAGFLPTLNEIVTEVQAAD
jgi:hypothetical protein